MRLIIILIITVLIIGGVIFVFTYYQGQKLSQAPQISSPTTPTTQTPPAASETKTIPSATPAIKIEIKNCGTTSGGVTFTQGTISADEKTKKA